MHIDLPIEALKQYKGKNPKPADFDMFWEDALAALDAVSLSYQLEAVDLGLRQAEAYYLSFTGVGGAKIYAKWVKPLKETATGQAVVMFHGYSVDSGDWIDKLAYAAEGIHVFALDCRGQGGRSEDLTATTGPTLRGHIIRGLHEEDPHKLYYRSVFLDAVQLIRIIGQMEGIDEQQIGTYGQSQGGALALAAAALVPEINQTFCVYPFLSDYQRAWEMDVSNSAYEEIAYYFRNFDPMHKREREIFTRLGYIDLQHLAPRIKAEVIMLTGMRDVICPPSTQYAVYNKLTTRKTHHLYHEYGHEFLPHHADDALMFFKGR